MDFTPAYQPLQNSNSAWFLGGRSGPIKNTVTLISTFSHLGPVLAHLPEIVGDVAKCKCREMV